MCGETPSRDARFCRRCGGRLPKAPLDGSDHLDAAEAALEGDVPVLPRSRPPPG
jgi:hypothetical protein